MIVTKYKMKQFILLSLSSILSLGFCSCQSETLRIVFSSQHYDEPTGFHEGQIYKLKKQAVNADFNMPQLHNIDHFRKDSTSLRKIFEPVSGRYNYYQFVATFKGQGMIFPGDDLKDSIQTFHDILIVKTNSENRIIDAFQYTLEWAEYPCQYDLFRATNLSLPLTDNMDISLLNFLRTESEFIKNDVLKQKGIVRLKKL